MSNLNQAERAAFEAWAKSNNFDIFSHEGNYFSLITESAWVAWQASRRAALEAVDAEGLTPLPEDKFCVWVHHGKIANAFTHGVGDRTVWDRDGYWSEKGFDREPLYTADQVRQAQREAVAADRLARQLAPMCERKTTMLESEGYKKSGYVLRQLGKDREVVVCDGGAVSWFTIEQWNWLMFNRDHIQFEWPTPFGQRTDLRTQLASKSQGEAAPSQETDKEKS